MIHRINGPMSSFTQSLPVQRREHDGSIQLGYLLRSHPDAHPRWPGSCRVPGSCKRGHQDHHHPQWGHLPQSTWAGWSSVWEVHDWGRGVLVSKLHFYQLWLVLSLRPNCDLSVNHLRKKNISPDICPAPMSISVTFHFLRSPAVTALTANRELLTRLITEPNHTPVTKVCASY